MDLPVLLRMMLALGLVLLVIFGSVRLVRRFGPLTIFARRTDEIRFDIVGQAPLGPKRSLMAVRVAGRTLLLGLTPAAINVLAELDPAPPETAAGPGPERGPFGRELAMALGGLERSRARLAGEDRP